MGSSANMVSQNACFWDRTTPLTRPKNKGFQSNGLQYEPEGTKPTVEMPKMTSRAKIHFEIRITQSFHKNHESNLSFARKHPELVQIRVFRANGL